MRFLTSKAARADRLLLAQGTLYYAIASRPERVRPVAPLQFFPAAIGPWRHVPGRACRTGSTGCPEGGRYAEPRYIDPSRGARRSCSSPISRPSAPAPRRIPRRTVCLARDGSPWRLPEPSPSRSPAARPPLS